MISLITYSTYFIMSMSIEAESDSGLAARLYDLLNYTPDCITRTESDSYLILGIRATYYRRLLCRMRYTMANDLEASTQATRLRTLTYRRTLVLINRLLVRTRRVTGLSTTCTSVTDQGILVEASITVRLDRRYLTRARGFYI